MKRTWPVLALAVVVATILIVTYPEPEREVVFVYEVGGRGETIDVRYLGDEGLVEEEVTVPWTSEEMYTTVTRDLHLEAEGSAGDSLVCGVRWRVPESRYGTDGSGERASKNDPEDAHLCDLDTTAG